MATLTSDARPIVSRTVFYAKPNRVLIVAPHFPPTNAPDHQRVRMALPWLAAEGWQAEVLAVDARFVEAALDPELASTLPPEVAIHRTAAIPVTWTRPFGWSSLARRAYRAFRHHGNDLLAGRRFDLVFFSTSQFGVLPLGLEWQRQHGIPYVLDLQDEWVSNYYHDRPEVSPPGGRFKYAVSRAGARGQESDVVRHAAQIVSVSEQYNANLLQRYPNLSPGRLHVLPFAGSEADFERLREKPVRHDFFRSGDGLNWVYVGRGGAAMRRAASAFFAATRRALNAGMFQGMDLRLHFIGTDYATGTRARLTFLPLACEFGLEEHVTESTDRVPYFTALQCLLDADALIVPGSDDPGYTASKIHSYALARRPMLAIFHEESGGAKVLQELEAGTVVTFSSKETTEVLSNHIYHGWFEPRAFDHAKLGEPRRLEPRGARAMTHRLAGIFQAACASTRESA